MNARGGPQPSYPDGPSPDTARLELYRERRGAGRLRAFRILVDDKPLGEIRRGETRTLSLTPGGHVLGLEVDAGGSRPLHIEIKPGETIRLVCWTNFKAWQVLKASRHQDEMIAVASRKP